MAWWRVWVKSGGADLYSVVGSVVGNGAVEHHMRGHSARLCAEGRSGCEAEHAGGECDHSEKAEKGRLHEANRSEGAVPRLLWIWACARPSTHDAISISAQMLRFLFYL